MRTLIAGVGNIFLGDDGFGPAVVQKLSGCSLPPGTKVEDFGIRGLHLAYELLEAWDLLLLVDAVDRKGPPGALYLIEPETEAELFAGGAVHGMDLPSVFALVRGMGGDLPRTLLVGCQPECLSERMGLGARVEAAVEKAAAWSLELVWEQADRRSVPVSK